MQTPDAGVLTDNSGNRGFQFIPEVGDQVMVSFEQGNPHRPYVSGSMYHGKNTQQVSNNIRSITTKSGSTIVFDDTEKSVLIQNKAGSRELLDGKGNIDVNTPKTISFTAGEDITMKATKNITLNASQNYNLTTGNNMDTNVGNNVVIAIINKDTYDSGDYTETVRGNKKVVVTGDFKETTGSYSHNAIKGDALITSTGVSKVIGKQDAIVNKGYFEKEADESEKQEETPPDITNCVVYFSECSDYMHLERDERKGLAVPDNSKIYGFDKMRSDYKDLYGYYWDGDFEQENTNDGSKKKPINIKDPLAKYENLEKEYKPSIITWKKAKKDKNKYYMPWLSIANGQKVRLQITMEWDKKPQKLEIGRAHV